MSNDRPCRVRRRRGLSQRQYAKHLGLSRGAVLKMLASDRLVLFPDGSIDAAASDLRRAETTVTMKRTTSPSERPNALTYATARAEREALKTELCRLQLQRRRGELVDRQRAVATVFRLARQERDAWLCWPPRVAALMAAELGVSAHTMQRVLAHHVHRHLSELADLQFDVR